MAKTSIATRPFFIANQNTDNRAYYEDSVSFTWHNGMSWQVRQRSSDAMREAILKKLNIEKAKEEEFLEVSTASRNYEIGTGLSALNLIYTDPQTRESYPVENWFQAAKVFGMAGNEKGPYPELLKVRLAKRYVNPSPDKKTVLQMKDDPLFQSIQNDINGASLTHFCMSRMTYPAVPRSAFYDYLYVSALNQRQNGKLADAVLSYRIFTDIMFNPGFGKRRRYNTQARSCAIYVSLRLSGKLVEGANLDFDSFVSAVKYPEELEDSPTEAQMSLF